MRLALLILPAVIGMVYAGRSGENVDYDPLKGPSNTPNGPPVQQNHGAIGDPVGAKARVEPGDRSGQRYDYNYYDGPPKTAQGPGVNMQHGYNGPPQAAPQTGGSSNDNDDGAGGAQRIFPPIIPGEDSNDDDYDGGLVLSGTGGAVGTNSGTGTGYAGQAATGGDAGDSSNSVDGAGGGGGAGGSPLAGGSNNNPAPVAGGADVSKALSQHQNQKLETQSSALSGGAVAGIVLGVAAVAAVGTAVAVVAVRSGASALSPA